MILNAVRRVPPTLWMRLQLMSLVGFMVPALILFAMAGTVLPWNHWILLLTPLPVLVFGAGIDRESSEPPRRNGARLGVALMLAWALGGFISLGADSTVPTIVWVLWAAAVLASICAFLSHAACSGSKMGHASITSEPLQPGEAPDNNEMQLTRSAWLTAGPPLQLISVLN